MSQETEVVRIEGNVTIPKGESRIFSNDFQVFIWNHQYTWSGSIVPQDSETVFALYKVEEITSYKQKIEEQNKSLHRQAELYNELVKKLKVSEEVIVMLKQMDANSKEIISILESKIKGRDETILILKQKLNKAEKRNQEPVKKESWWRRLFKRK